jgi:hypothetical protein
MSSRARRHVGLTWTASVKPEREKASGSSGARAAGLANVEFLSISRRSPSPIHLAALALEHGAELCSPDVDFSRFAGLAGPTQSHPHEADLGPPGTSLRLRAPL